jgi:predicted CXXCH cytochrome family protein
MVCHLPHASASDHLLVSPIGNACLSCHKRVIKSATGNAIADIDHELKTALYTHGPVQKGQCTACHVGHSSPYRALLAKKFTVDQYVSYSEEEYALCFQCHDSALISESCNTQTGFRHGSRNLHYVHVVREKGRSCGLCHTPHGSRNPKQIRESVPFGTGGWSLPVAFKKTENGGTCTSGCHNPITFDRSATSDTIPPNPSSR